jgi:hypothetical protein
MAHVVRAPHGYLPLLAMLVFAGVYSERPRAQTPAPPTCTDVSKTPEKFVGQAVEFYGSLTGMDLKPTSGKQDLLDTWSCKDKDGHPMTGSFGFWNVDSKWSDPATKASAIKDLFHISATVKGIEGTLPMLKDVSVKLATEK